MSYWALGEMVKAQAGILETDSAAKTARKLREALASLLPDASESCGSNHTCGRSSVS